MADLGRDAEHEEYLRSATTMLGRFPAAEAATQFGLDGADAGEPGAQTAALAFLEAEGYHLGTSSVLARFALFGAPGTTLGAVYADAWSDDSWATTGWTGQDPLVLELPDRGLVELAPADLVRVRTDEATEYLTVLRVRPGVTGHPGDGLAAADAGPRILAHLRVGAAAETLGVCTRLLEDAAAHAQLRHQFGSALADFARVQDLLAWAAAERHQLMALLDAVAALPLDSPAGYEAARTVKALAGRAGRRIAQASLQVTGGIAFTWEHTHHRFHRRLLLLDALGGSSGDLVREIGGSIRASGALPDYIGLERGRTPGAVHGV